MNTLVSIPEHRFSLPLNHLCGCTVEWMVDIKKKDQLDTFFPTVVEFPCPWHGSSTGIPAMEPKEGEWVYLVDCRIWYTKADPSQFKNGQKNQEIARWKALKSCLDRGTKGHMDRRARIDLDAPTIAAVAPALALENLRRAREGRIPLTLAEYARRELTATAQRQLAQSEQQPPIARESTEERQ